MGQPLTPVEVIRARLEELREKAKNPGPHDSVIAGPLLLAGQIAGLEFELRALGVES